MNAQLTAPDPKRGRRGRWILIATAGVAVGVIVVVGVVGSGDGSEATSSGSSLPPATETVTTATLVESVEADGTLNHGEPIGVPAQLDGTITELASEGATVTQGNALFWVDDDPVVLLYGDLPAYRALTVGTEGSDVEQFEANLAAFGYAGYTVDAVYTAATAAAVADWQADIGVAETGTIELGQVIYAPDAVRIAEHTASPGATAASGQDVLSYTATTRLVTVDLPVEHAALAAEGAAVTVDLPDGTEVAGTVTEVGSVATAPSGGDGQNDGPAAPGSADAEPTIDVTVQIADQAALGDLDQAPVGVRFVSETREDVLTVPVAALVALDGGGYGVEVVEGDSSDIVPVELGMFADGRVEVTAGDVVEGMAVGVPAS